MNYVNICVMNINEGGDVYVEEKMDDMFLKMFLDGFKEDNGDGSCEWGVVDLEEGLSELDDYYMDNGNGMEEDERLDKEWEKVKDEFRSKVKGKEGFFWLWGVEYDYELMFVEEDSIEELFSLEFDDDGYGSVSIKS